MIINKRLKIDFAQRGLCQQVFVVQGDCLSRGITFSLYENGTPWELPSGVTPALRYGKSDGTGGVYDTLPDGSAAWTAEGNEVGMLLAPQVMTVPGLVQCQLMLAKNETILGSFSFHLIVEQDPAYDAVESKGYFNWSKVVGNLIMAPQAEVGQIIRVKTVDGEGNPTEWEAVDFTESAQNVNLTTAQVDALDGMFKVCAFIKDDVSTEYNAFKTAFGISDSGGEEEPDIPDDPTVKTYSISKELVNVTSHNSATSVSEGASYTATLSASDGYTLDGATVTVTMGGVDITSTAYVSGVISIASVTGNVEIFASAVQIEEVPAELNTDGLVFNFDFRNAVMESYNLSGWGNVYRTVDKTGNALIFGSGAATGDDKGLVNYSFRENRLVSSETQKVQLGESYTVQALYRQNDSRVQSNLFGWGTGIVITGNFRTGPRYLVGTTETSATVADYAHEDTLYTVVTYVANGASLTIYHNTDIVHTDDGSKYEGFTKWMDYGVPNTIYNNGYSTAFVGYNRALTQQEIIENIAFFKTMEVSA